jgi:hypothetical protein
LKITEQIVHQRSFFLAVGMNRLFHLFVVLLLVTTVLKVSAREDDEEWFEDLAANTPSPQPQQDETYVDLTQTEIFMEVPAAGDPSTFAFEGLSSEQFDEQEDLSSLKAQSDLNSLEGLFDHINSTNVDEVSSEDIQREDSSDEEAAEIDQEIASESHETDEIPSRKTREHFNEEADSFSSTDEVEAIKGEMIDETDFRPEDVVVSEKDDSSETPEIVQPHVAPTGDSEQANELSSDSNEKDNSGGASEDEDILVSINLGEKAEESNAAYNADEASENEEVLVAANVVEKAEVVAENLTDSSIDSTLDLDTTEVTQNEDNEEIAESNEVSFSSHEQVEDVLESVRKNETQGTDQEDEQLPETHGTEDAGANDSDNIQEVTDDDSSTEEVDLGAETVADEGLANTSDDDWDNVENVEIIPEKNEFLENASRVVQEITSTEESLKLKVRNLKTLIDFQSTLDAQFQQIENQVKQLHAIEKTIADHLNSLEDQLHTGAKQDKLNIKVQVYQMLSSMSSQLQDTLLKDVDSSEDSNHSALQPLYHIVRRSSARMFIFLKKVITFFTDYTWKNFRFASTMVRRIIESNTINVTIPELVQDLLSSPALQTAKEKVHELLRPVLDLVRELTAGFRPEIEKLINTAQQALGF